MRLRWDAILNSDPIGLDGGANRFGYAEANSLMYLDPLGLASEFKVKFGKGKGFGPDLPKTTKETTERRQGPGADAGDTMKCAFSLRNCDAEIGIKEARMCVLAKCTTCDGNTFLTGPEAPNASAYDPAKTTCECIKYGFNPNYVGGAPPGLTAPGK
jgi:hypothetical protein